MIRILVIAIALGLYAGTICSQEVQRLRINPAEAFGGTVSEYFDKIEYIPLETTKQSLFGTASKLIITSGSFVVNDFDTRSVLFFSLKGKYLNKVQWESKSPYEISYNEDSSRIEISSYKAGVKKVTFYSLSGVKEGSPQNVNNNLSPNLIPLSDDFKVENVPFLSRFNYRIVDSSINLINIYKGDSVYKSFFSFNPGGNFLVSKKFYSLIENPRIGTPEHIYITVPIINEVLKINRDTLIRAYKFVFPSKYTLPTAISSIRNEAEYMKYQKSIELPNFYIFSVGNFFLNKSVIFFRVETSKTSYSGGSQESSSVNFMFDSISKKLSSFERINPDKLSCFLPIMSGTSLRNGIYSYNGSLYNTISSLEMFAAQEATKLRQPEYPPVLLEYFETQNRKSNPVIVKMKLKE